MDRFKEPTKDEEDWQAAMEQIAEELHEQLGREPTDEEIQAMADYYECEQDDHIENMIEELNIIAKEEDE